MTSRSSLITVTRKGVNGMGGGKKHRPPCALVYPILSCAKRRPVHPFPSSVPQHKQAASTVRPNTVRRRFKHNIFQLLPSHFVARFIELTPTGQESGVKCENSVISFKSCLVRSHSTSLKPTWPLCLLVADREWGVKSFLLFECCVWRLFYGASLPPTVLSHP